MISKKKSRNKATEHLFNSSEINDEHEEAWSESAASSSSTSEYCSVQQLDVVRDASKPKSILLPKESFICATGLYIS